MLRISSVWRIRQIKFQKQFKKCKHFIPVFEILLGSEQLQIIMPFMVEIRLWKTANRWVSFVWDKQLWQYKYNIDGYAAITKKIKLVYMRNKIRYIIKKSKKLLTIQIQDDIIYKLSARTTRNSTESVRSKRNLKINEKSCWQTSSDLIK